MLDIFKSDAFGVVALTDAILKTPYKPGRIGELGIFRERGVTATTIVVEEKDGRLSLIPTSPRGAPGTSIGEKKRTVRSFAVPHLQRETTLMADQVQNVRAFGSTDATVGIQTLVNERLTDLRAMHEVTLEHLRAGAIQGNILDADGATVIFNLFTEFGVTQQTANINYNTTTDKGDQLRASVVAAQRLAELELGGEPISGYRALCGKTFYDNVRGDLGLAQSLRFADPIMNLQQQANARRFLFAGVEWEEYRAKTGLTDGSEALGYLGTGNPFIADAEAYLFPEGTNIFATYYAPADFIETVNTIGLPMYAKIAYDDEFNRFVKIHSQSNPLALCLRPRAVIKLAAVSV